MNDYKIRQVDQIMISVHAYNQEELSLNSLIQNLIVLVDLIKSENDLIIQELNDCIGSLELINAMQLYENRPNLSNEEKMEIDKILEKILQDIDILKGRV